MISILILSGPNSYIDLVTESLASKYSPVDLLILEEYPNWEAFQLVMDCKKGLTPLMSLWIPRRIVPRLRSLERILFTFVNLLFHFLLAIYVVRRRKRRYHICISNGWPVAIIALVLRSIGLCKKVIYWKSDHFVASRLYPGYWNFFIKTIYPCVERRLVKSCDSVWCLTEKMKKATLLLTQYRFVDKLMVVPPPIPPRAPASVKKNPSLFVYFGEVKEGTVLPFLLERVWPMLSDDYILFVIGRIKDPSLFQSPTVRGMIERGKVRVVGFMPRHALDKLMLECAGGIAIFPAGHENLSNYVFPSKVVKYLRNLVPVITNEDSAIAEIVVKEKLGLTVKIDQSSIVKAIEALSFDCVNAKRFVRSVHDFVSSGRGVHLFNLSIKKTIMKLFDINNE